MQERLQKIIARAGLASRRHAEQLILSGLVTVNGRIVSELGSKADSAKDAIKVAGKLLRIPQQKDYLMLHKPAGCVATMSDPEGRATLRDHLRGFSGRVFPLGGMEYQSSGLVLLTGDGELGNFALKEFPKLQQVWWVKIKGQLSDESRRAAQTASSSQIRMHKPGENAWYHVSLRGGELEKLQLSLTHSGHPVEKMKRAELAGLELGDLPVGHWRRLEPGEVARLQRMAKGRDVRHGEKQPASGRSKGTHAKSSRSRFRPPRRTKAFGTKKSA